MAELDPVYLIHGDDGAKVDEWRSRVVRRAEAELGPGGCERIDPTTQEPEQLAASLATLSFQTGTRYILADDAGAWKAGALDPLVAALAQMPPETVLVLIVRGKPVKKLLDAVKAAGGRLHEYASPKPWELPRWVAQRADEQGMRIDAEAAKQLVTSVGNSQQRLMRELEKLAIAIHPETRVGVEEVERHTAGERSPKVYDLADAVVSGDLISTLALAEDLVGHGEPPGRLVYPVANRLREVHRTLELLDAGVSEKDLASKTKAPPWRVKKTLALVRKTDGDVLRRAICTISDLEVDLRGGGASLDGETSLTLALARAATA